MKKSSIKSIGCTFRKTDPFLKINFN